MAAPVSGPIFDTVALIGVGLIGSSIARAVRRSGVAKSLVAYSRKPETREEIAALGIVDRVADTVGRAVKTADLVIFCTPVQTYPTIAKTIAPHLKAGAVISDVGSVKQSVVTDVTPHLPQYVDFVPAHPIAGTEHSGPTAGFAELFDDRWCILTPTETAGMASVDRLTRFWQGLGANVECMSAEHHDLVLGITSHLPHLIAYTIVGTANSLEGRLQSEVIKYSAGGFRDFTRIAASDPTMWRDIFMTNQGAVLDLLARFENDLSQLKTAIETSDAQTLFDWFTQTRDIRRSIVEQGQAGHFDPRETAASHLNDEGFIGLYGD